MPTPLPSLSKNWCTRANIPFPSNTTVENIADSAWWLLKACLMDQVTTGTLTGVRHANSVWSMVRSSDGIAAGTTEDGIDRWGTVFDASKLVHNVSTSPHSWVILRSHTSFGMDLLIGLNSGTVTSGRVAATLSVTPFTGGGVNTEPATTGEAFCHGAATDSVSSAPQVIADTTVSGTFYAHFSCDDQGQFVFLVNRVGTGIFNGGVGLFRTINPDPGDYRNTFLFGGTGLTTGRGWPSASLVYGTAGCTARSAVGTSAQNTSSIAIPWAASQSVLEQNSVTDALLGIVRLIKLSCWDISTLAPCFRGDVVDIYGVVGGGVGASYPSVAAQTWIQAGNFLVPFIGTQPLL